MRQRMEGLKRQPKMTLSSICIIIHPDKAAQAMTRKKDNNTWGKSFQCSPIFLSQFVQSIQDTFSNNL